VGAWHNAGIKSVVSLLEAPEVRDLDLRAEPTLCAEHGIDCRSFPIPDRGTPSSARELSALLAPLHAELLQGHAVAIHCRAGIGRTGLVAGCLLHLLGVPYEDIFHLLSRSRGLAVPDTAAQVEWVERFARAQDRHQ
jgi:protein-tyrosine phosphatase